MLSRTRSHRGLSNTPTIYKPHHGSHLHPKPQFESANMPADAAPSQDVKRRAAREVIDILHEIATLLARVFPPSCVTSTNVVQNTQLDRQQLSYCVSLIENGANPEALAVRPPTLPSSSSAVVPYPRVWQLCYGKISNANARRRHADNVAESHPRAPRRVWHRKRGWRRGRGWWALRFSG